MSDSKHCGGSGASLAGTIWFMGWLFTISFAKLICGR